MRAAVIGIGSNSLRLLVADISNGNQAAVFRKREGLRVFASLNDKLEITQEMIRNACGAVLRMRQTAEMLGAEQIRMFATSAVRDAANRQALTDTLLQKTGLMLDICSGEMEAKLSFLGAAGEQRLGMIDIGGGSTEIVIGEHEIVEFSCSLQVGAVRLFREMKIQSVPDANHAMDTVKALLNPYRNKIRQVKTPTKWVGVGGTLTAAATAMQNIAWDTRKCIHGFSAEHSEVRRILETFADMTPDQRRNARSIPPDRADIIVHGFAILLACMEALSIDRIIVSEHTNLDGYLKLITADESGSTA